MANAFMQSAARSKRAQKAIEESGAEVEETKPINVRIPASLHYKARLHSVETGENITQLVNRLLKKELGE